MQFVWRWHTHWTRLIYQCIYPNEIKEGDANLRYSDNGTNFVGAERELRELVKSLDQDQDRITQETNKYHLIDWKLNPPAAPHFGGVFKAMIKSAKAIKAILVGTLVEFQTHPVCELRSW